MKGSKPCPVDKDACRAHAVKGIKGGPDGARTPLPSESLFFTRLPSSTSLSSILTSLAHSRLAILLAPAPQASH